MLTWLNTHFHSKAHLRMIAVLSEYGAGSRNAASARPLNASRSCARENHLHAHAYVSASNTTHCTRTCRTYRASSSSCVSSVIGCLAEAARATKPSMSDAGNGHGCELTYCIGACASTRTPVSSKSSRAAASSALSPCSMKPATSEYTPYGNALNKYEPVTTALARIIVHWSVTGAKAALRVSKHSSPCCANTMATGSLRGKISVPQPPPALPLFVQRRCAPACCSERATKQNAPSEMLLAFASLPFSMICFVCVFNENMRGNKWEHAHTYCHFCFRSALAAEAR